MTEQHFERRRGKVPLVGVKVLENGVVSDETNPPDYDAYGREIILPRLPAKCTATAAADGVNFSLTRPAEWTVVAFLGVTRY
jgi:hypothetical protein